MSGFGGVVAAVGGAGGSLATGGSLTTGGSLATGGVAAVDPCLTDPMDTPQTPTPYTLNTALRACLSADRVTADGLTGLDVDTYSFTTPNDGGGVVLVRISDIVMQGFRHNTWAFELKVTLTLSGGQVVNAVNNEGTTATASDIAFWFGALGNTEYHLSVAFDDPPQIDLTEYTLRADYISAPDPFEPNNTFGLGAPADPRISVGQPIQAYFLGGYGTSSGPAFDDYYLVTLAPGTAKVTVSNVASDVLLASNVISPDGNNPDMISSDGKLADKPGDGLTYDVQAPHGGDVIVGVWAGSPMKPFGLGSTLPRSMLRSRTHSW